MYRFIKFTRQPFIFILLFLLFPVLNGQNLEKIAIEKAQPGTVVIPKECKPDNFIIVINSTLRDLVFNSSMLKDQDFLVIPDTVANQYIICHEKMRFKLIISGPNYYEEIIDIFNMDERYAFNVTSNTIKGTITVKTIPGNANITFKELNNEPRLSGKPVTLVADQYKVRISKRGYHDIDTTLLVSGNNSLVYNFDLVQDFPALKLELKTSDYVKFTEPPTLWIDTIQVGLEPIVDPTSKVGDFDMDLTYYLLYEGNIIPVPEAGSHKIKITADGFQPFEKVIYFEKGKSIPLSAELEPLYGFLSVRDVGKSEGASVFVDGKEIGQIPIFEHKLRIGNHEIRVKKNGYLPDRDDIPVRITDNQNSILEISMEIFRKVTIESSPPKADIFLNGKWIGFTSKTIELAAAYHTLLLKKSGYCTMKEELQIDDKTRNDDTLQVDLKKNEPITFNSEIDNLKVSLNGLDSLDHLYFETDILTGGKVSIPYGNYNVKIFNGSHSVFKGKFVYNEFCKGKAVFPCYSSLSFRLLAGDFINHNNFEISFGQANLFRGTGLSTSIANVQFFNKELELSDDQGVVNKQMVKMLIPSLFMMNWDFRTGGSLIRFLDVCALARIKYTPGFKVVNLGIKGYNDASVFSYFYGIEISSRLPYLNINCKMGMQNMTGTCHLYDSENKIYQNEGILFKVNQPVVSVGITLNGPIYGINNMIRLWNTPILGFTAPYMVGPERFRKKKDTVH